MNTLPLSIPSQLGIAGFALLVTLQPVRADDALDIRMNALANQSGCLTCHSVRGPGHAPAGMKVIAPNWTDVADRYRGQGGAQDALTTTVLHGSSAYAPHWKWKVSGYAMPPNEVAIDAAHARELVGWILQLH